MFNLNNQEFVNFLIHELIHILLGLFLFLTLARIIHRLKPLIVAFLVSLFLDIDHLFDYFLALGFTLNLEAVADGRYFDISNKLFIPLHSWELALSLLIWGWMKRRKKSGILAVAIGSGIFTHLLVDQVWYQPGFGSYFLILRMLHGFSFPTIW